MIYIYNFYIIHYLNIPKEQIYNFTIAYTGIYFSISFGYFYCK